MMKRQLGAIIAILGTIFTLIYTLLYPVLGLSPYGYGILRATPHEIAHVIAARRQEEVQL